MAPDDAPTRFSAKTDHQKAEVEEQSVEEAAKLSSKLVYEVIRRDGEEELARSNRSLFLAGLGAGILIAFSLLAEAILRTYLPDAPWAFLVENFGYSLGFILVILGRMQLFTENTITTVLPFMRRPCLELGLSVLRLWGIVLLANVCGAAIAGTWLTIADSVTHEVLPAMEDLARHAVGFGAWPSFIRAIPAGLLVAAIVWMMPQVEGSEVGVILLFTWLIAAGDFTHVVVGSVEAAFLLASGELGIGAAFFSFFLPVLAGNVVGGTLIFALMAWGQVRDDYEPHLRRR